MLTNGFPRIPKVVQLQAAVTTNGAKTTQYINAAKCSMIYFIVSLQNTAGDATVLSIYEATNASGGSAAAITTAMPVYYSNDTEAALGDNLTLVTSAATLTVGSAISEKIAIIQVDPSIMTSGMDFFAVHATTSTEATNFMTVIAVAGNRHGGYDDVTLLA